MQSPFSRDIEPNWEGLIHCIARQAEPERVHYIELFLDWEVKQAICERYDLAAGLERGDPFFAEKLEIRLQRFLGYDYVLCGLEGLEMPTHWLMTEDTAALQRAEGRRYQDEHSGPITSWESFEVYPWPDPQRCGTRALEWYQRNLPDDMCIIGGLTGHVFENLSQLMGYETLCYAIYDQPDLVEAIGARCQAIDTQVVKRLLEFDRVKMIWGSDDLGFRSGTLISPRDMRRLVLPAHKTLADLTHQAGRLYLLHSCGNLASIMADLIDEVRIDAKHSFEDTIVDVREAKRLWGDRLALLGGMDLDFLCTAGEDTIRSRVRDTLKTCMPGGGYCLGTGNTVANYLPLESYLVVLDEGRRFA